MKRRSGTSGGARRQPEPTFFTDRDLGKRFAEILRENGLRVEPYHEHFESGTVPDTEWLEYVGAHGWVAVTHNRRQIINREERDAAMRAGVTVFYVVGKAPYAELALAFVDARAQVMRLLRAHKDPFLAKVYKLAPGQNQRVRVAMTDAKWLKIL